MGWLIGRVLFAVPSRDGTVGDHPSRDAVAGAVWQPTRELERAALPATGPKPRACTHCLVLLQVGFT